MESLQWLFSEIVKYLADLFISLLTYGISFALLGLVIGIVGVIIADRSGAFKRPNSLWSLIARLNYVYVPVVLAVFGGFLGTVYGTHSCADQFIDDTAKPLAQYGQTYMTQAMAIVPEIPWERHQDKSLDEILADEMSQRLGTEQGSTAHQFFTVINQSVVKHALKEAGVPSTLSDPMDVIRDFKTRRVPSNAYISLTRTIHQHCDAYFSLKYAFVFWIFLPFLLLPFAEYLLYWFTGRRPLAQQTAAFNQTPSFDVSAPPVKSIKIDEAPTAEIKEVPAVMTYNTVEAPEPELSVVPEDLKMEAEALVPAVKETPEVMAFKAVEASEPEVKEVAVAMKPVEAPLVVAAKTYHQNPIPTNVQTSINNMKQIPSSTAVTYILGGALLQLYAGIGSGWLSVFIAIFGFVIFYLGLEKLKLGLDSTGQSAVSMLKMAAIIGAISAVIDLIPIVGIISTLGYMAAYTIELVGYLKLKNSRNIGAEGSSGTTYLFIAMILAVVQSLFGLLPFIGGYIAGPIGFVALMLVFFGWVKVQEGMHQVANSTLDSNSGIG